MKKKQEDAYVSPLMSRITTEESLTLKNLAHYVPMVQKATEVKKDTENSAGYTSTELFKIARDGENAKEKLIIMALPLIKKIAYKEFSRRRAWNSRVSFEDMVQEGIGGFLRGIQAYNVNAGHTSATNYLGQWILSDMRRNIELLEHDFTIPQETIERYRKIRAIRGRLTNTLGRAPTDQEIIDSASSADSAVENKMGRVNKDPNAPRKPLTQKQLDEERAYYSSTGQISSLIVANEEGEPDYELEAAPLLEASVNETAEAVEDRDSAEYTKNFLARILEKMQLGNTQKDIIARKYGLAPYTSEHTTKDISDATKITKYKVGAVLSAFATEMTKKGGIFHYYISRTPYQELESMNMQWILPIVGEWSKGTAPSAVADSLTLPLRPVPTRRSFGKAGRNIKGYVAEFFCERHQLSFTANYLSIGSAPESHACPKCGEQSPRV